MAVTLGDIRTLLLGTDLPDDTPLFVDEPGTEYPGERVTFEAETFAAETAGGRVILVVRVN